MQGFIHLTLELEKRGDGEGVLVGALQQVGGHDLERSREVDSTYMGGSIQLP